MRVAGFLYLLLVLAAPLRLIYIPAKLFVHENATVTANNITAHELLFRLGIVSDLFCGTILIFLVLALYRLFKAVDPNLAVLVVIPRGCDASRHRLLQRAERRRCPDARARRRFLVGIRKTSARRLGHAIPPFASPGDRCRRDPLGSMAFSLSDSCVQVALPAPLPGHVADHQRFRIAFPAQAS
jgi:hypothetical protein